MMGTSKKKRSPGLWVPKKVTKVPYISPFYEFLKQNNVVFRGKNWTYE